MDARIVAESAQISLRAVAPAANTVIKVEELIEKLVSLFDPATVLAPLLHTGNSLTAVAPNTFNTRGVGAWANA